MGKEIIESLIHVIAILPLLFLCIKTDNSKRIKLIILFVMYFIGYQVLLRLPFYFSSFQFIEGDWNWSGKLLAIIGSLIFYSFFKNNFYPHHFLTIKQEKKSLRRIIIIIAVISVISIIGGFLFNNESWNLETLFFQLTLPGMDEEIAYRGIMLGILSSILSEKIRIFKITISNPSIWIIGILFGLIHALKLNSDWELSFNILYFVETFILGTVWGWMAVKSKSILLPIISHNLSNTFMSLIGMIK
ncbi:MAG: CPBP family intramembrane metalloprotease [Flavobacteriaceae bacterium]|nr:MAG: CPBP family intramembrane metalloprotease [Flavobacteriaceae bacterium]